MNRRNFLKTIVVVGVAPLPVMATTSKSLTQDSTGELLQTIHGLMTPEEALTYIRKSVESNIRSLLRQSNHTEASKSE